MQLRRALPRLRALRRVRRGAALLMLLVLAVFLAAGSHDHCGEAHDHGHEPFHAQHLLCPDDCAPALFPAPPAPPPADSLPRPVYREAVVQKIRSFDLEPEKAPPRP